jgi:RimJ/RimL family protein N-acetyltransferase
MRLATPIDGETLRSLCEVDADRYIALVRENIGHLTQHGDYGELFDVTDEALREEVLQAPPELTFIVDLREELIGRVDLVPREEGHVVLGYWLAASHSGHGYMHAALTALLDHAKHALGATDVFAGVTKGNERSKAVLLRLGFECVSDEGSYDRYHRPLV